MRSILALAVLSPALLAQDAATDVPLRHRAQRSWSIDLPAEKWRPVGTEFAVLGRRFAVRPEGTRLLVDTDGDGETETALEGETAFVTLRARTETGAKLAWSIRLRNADGWSFAPGGVRRGKIGATKVQLIDQNGNGRFDDVGADAMVVGSGRAAAFLSEVVAVGDELLAIEVAADGASLQTRPFDGPTGKLELACKTRGKILSAVVRSTDRRYSFDLRRGAANQKVPVGEYVLACGQLGLGENSVRVETGRSEPIAVTADTPQRVCWGGPIKAEFTYRRQGDKVHLSPADVHYYGALGERYTTWTPRGSSPEFEITDKASREVLATAYFAGSC